MIYNLLIKKVYVLRDVNFDKSFAYDANLTKDGKVEIGEFWSFENDKELALKEKK